MKLHHCTACAKFSRSSSRAPHGQAYISSSGVEMSILLSVHLAHSSSTRSTPSATAAPAMSARAEAHTKSWHSLTWQLPEGFANHPYCSCDVLPVVCVQVKLPAVSSNSSSRTGSPARPWKPAAPGALSPGIAGAVWFAAVLLLQCSARRRAGCSWASKHRCTQQQAKHKAQQQAHAQSDSQECVRPHEQI
jgi:hypothetical protein